MSIDSATSYWPESDTFAALTEWDTDSKSILSLSEQWDLSLHECLFLECLKENRSNIQNMKYLMHITHMEKYSIYDSI